MRLIVFACDAVDAVVYCGGVISSALDRGASITTVLLDVPEPGWARGDADVAEWTARLGCHDLSSVVVSERLQAAVEIVRRTDPTVGLCPTSTSVDSHARAVAEFAFEATYAATLPNFDTRGDAPPGSVRCPLFEFDDPRSARFRPDEFVDISAAWPDKLTTLESAPPALFGRTPRAQALETARQLGQLRGQQVQVPVAEAFSTVMTWGRVPHAARKGGWGGHR